jgi:hypothetical protein
MFPSFKLGLAAACCVLSVGTAQAKIYYVKNSGSDSYTGTNSLFPIKTLARVNAIVVAGDIVNLARGSVWSEPLQAKSGVLYQDWGTGTAKPLIRRSTDLSALTWTAQGNGIYAASTVNLTGTITQLTLGGNRLQRARHPNVGTKYAYTGADSASTTLNIRSGDVPAQVSLTGATAYLVTDGYYLRSYGITGTTMAGSQYGLTPQAHDPRFPNVKLYSNWNIKSGAPYWLENQLWMLDADNEWFHDTVARKLYLRLPGGVTPKGTALQGSLSVPGQDPAGVYCNGCTNTTLQNIEVRETAGDGVIFLNGSNIVLNSVDVTNPGLRGISLPGSNLSKVNAAKVNGSMMEGIWMGDTKYPETFPGKTVTVTGSTVTDAGKGLYAVAAIQSGYANTITNNNVIRPVYNGIIAAQDTLVQGNYVEDACYEYGDCAALYTTNADETYSATTANNQVPAGYALNVSFLNNIVNRTHLSAVPNLGAKVGIYLDGMSRNVVVRGNFIQGTDLGIFGNFVRDIDISGNVTFKNLAHELALQELSNNSDPHPNLQSCVYYNLSSCIQGLDYSVGNTFNNNVFVHAEGTATVKLSSGFGNTADFGSFTGNRYANLSNAIVAEEASANLPVQAHTLRSWQASGRDAQAVLYASYFNAQPAAGAAEVLSNGNFENGVSNWWMYKDGDFRTVGDACLSTSCFAITLNGNSLDTVNNLKTVGVFTTALAQPDFPMQQGKTYLLTFDAKSAGGTVQMAAVARDRNLYPLTTWCSPSLSTSWQHFTFRLRAESTQAMSGLLLSIAGPLGSTAYLDNISLKEAQLSGNTSNAAFSFVNNGPQALSQACPATDQTLCTQYMDAVTGANVSFPLSVPARGAMVVVLKNNPWRDDDADGIPNAADSCANTAVGTGSNSLGCAIGQ